MPANHFRKNPLNLRGVRLRADRFEAPSQPAACEAHEDADDSRAPDSRPEHRFDPAALLNRFCEKHRFSRAAVVTAACLILLLLADVAAHGIVTSTRLINKTTRLGLQDIGELATQAGYYTNFQSISNARSVFGWTVPFTSNKYIFSYDGVIKAGIDFSRITYEVNEAAHTITVTLPEAEILSNEIDENSLQIFDETKNIFTPLSIATLSDARSDMKEDAQRRAVENGLLDSARQNAELLIRGFLAGTYDLQVYDVNFVR